MGDCAHRIKGNNPLIVAQRACSERRLPAPSHPRKATARVLRIDTGYARIHGDRLGFGVEATLTRAPPLFTRPAIEVP
ncbi:hypothetical protein A9404_09255 [Halothiobacillus diazotrophicus]|uniref:Uncharacterized protein n=1 Tax=Halothiobacillus diazotrophicus TaxID=1860122 RepID=A0A191ZI56_9GAMM|nr:hypothetical protein A9404_09255 [Halothiobacillus diazotrophicus]